MHDHYATTEIDPSCPICQLAQATAPIDLGDHDPSGRGCAIAGRVMSGDQEPTGDACNACLVGNGHPELVWKSSRTIQAELDAETAYANAVDLLPCGCAGGAYGHGDGCTDMNWLEGIAHLATQAYRTGEDGDAETLRQTLEGLVQDATDFLAILTARQTTTA